MTYIRIVRGVATLLLVALPFSGEAQPTTKVPRVGILAGTIRPPAPRANALVAGLGDFGYVDGQTVIIEWRLSDGRAERLPDLAADLVRVDKDRELGMAGHEADERQRVHDVN